jgi:very-short-patch-repair endonuclease
VQEYKFYPTRRWRIDYAFVKEKIAIEIEGGVWSNGRHVRGNGFLGDMEKYNTLTEAGWRLLRYTPRNIDFEQIKRVYIQQGGK